MAFKGVRGNNVRAPQGGGGARRYALIPEGVYVARVDNGKQETYQSKKNNKISYAKVTPLIVLLNENSTEISRQDITLGVIDSEGYFYRPDGDEDKPALFSEAIFMLSALGFVYVDDEGNELVDLAGFDAGLLLGQHVKVKIEHDSYTDRDGNERQKNRITGFYPLDEADIEEYGLYFDGETGMVFADENRAAIYLELRESVLSGDGEELPF